MWARVGAVALVVVLLGGCGVGVQDQPEPAQQGPLAASAVGPAAGDATLPVPVPVFFVRAGHLAAVTRSLSRADRLQQAVAALAAGPAPSDGAGLRTALPPNVNRLDLQVTDGIVTVAVPGAFDRIGARNEVLAVGQLVFTVMAQPGIRGLQLTSGGVPIQVPTDSGRLVNRPVTRSDFPSIAPY